MAEFSGVPAYPPCWLKKTLPADELYGYSKDKLEQLAVRHLYQLELSLNPSPPH
ncbi:TPA: replication protein RepA [Klebsiella pneumoniae subsp. pneumoniae]|nr:replication protein RepA [Klebsiella pneumoniae subsp. pneumoniae]